MAGNVSMPNGGLSQTDKANIVNKAVDMVMEKTLFIDIESGYFSKGLSTEGEFFFDDAPEFLSSDGFGIGCLQGYRFKGVYKDKIFDLSAELITGEECLAVFTGYDVEKDRFFRGVLRQDEVYATFVVAERYMGKTIYITPNGYAYNPVNGASDLMRSVVNLAELMAAPERYRFYYLENREVDEYDVQAIPLGFKHRDDCGMTFWGHLQDGSLIHGEWFGDYVDWEHIPGNGGNPCLIEGTPINMADGSVKAVEEVKTGDIVQSYDPATETIVPAVVIATYKTGENREFTAYNFTNGKHLTVYGMHGIYNKRSGVTKDMRELKAKDEIVTLSDGVVQWAAKRTVYFSGEKKRRYNLVTSNNLYFANGILLGSRPYNKLQFAIDRKIPLSEEIRAAWQTDVDIYSAHNAVLNSPEFYAEVNADYVAYAVAKRAIEDAKQSLCDTDYKAQKYVEGALDDEEWQSVKAQRAAWREEVNTNEVIVKEKFAIIRETLRKYRGGKTSRAIFEECCTRDNALFEVVKAYFANGGNIN